MGGYFEYSLYDDCWYKNDDTLPSRDLLNQTGRKWWGPPQTHNEDLIKAMVSGALNNYACGGYAASFVWLNNDKVKKALNVAADAKFFSGDNGVGFTYNMTEPNLLPFYKEVVENTDLKVLVYNGDTDPCLDSLTA